MSAGKVLPGLFLGSEENPSVPREPPHFLGTEENNEARDAPAHPRSCFAGLASVKAEVTPHGSALAFRLPGELDPL